MCKVKGVAHFTLG